MYDTFHFSSSGFSVNNIPLTLSHHYNYHHITYLIYAAKQQPYVVTLQLTIFLTTSTSQYTIFSYIFSALKLKQFLQYLPKHKLKSSSLLHNTKRPTEWSGHVKMIDPPENCYIQKTFHPRG